MIFKNNYLKYRDNIPAWLETKKFMCVRCGSSPLYLTENNCPFPACEDRTVVEGKEDIELSLNLGICLLKYMHDKYDNVYLDCENEKIYNELFLCLDSALPIVEDNFENITKPNIYISKISGEVHRDKKIQGTL